MGDISEDLVVRYPRSTKVRATGLKLTELNGEFGITNGRCENGRVGVAFPAPFLTKALKPENLIIEDVFEEDEPQVQWRIVGGDGNEEELQGDVDFDVGGKEISFKYGAGAQSWQQNNQEFMMHAFGIPSDVDIVLEQE